MAQLSDDCFAFGSAPMPLAQAAAQLRARVAAVAETEQVVLAEAGGRVLAEDLVAPISLPPFDNSAVDGFAVRHADLQIDAQQQVELAAVEEDGASLRRNRGLLNHRLGA